MSRQSEPRWGVSVWGKTAKMMGFVGSETSTKPVELNMPMMAYSCPVLSSVHLTDRNERRSKLCPKQHGAFEVLKIALCRRRIV
jgi:hypothetical protein